MSRMEVDDEDRTESGTELIVVQKDEHTRAQQRRDVGGTTEQSTYHPVSSELYNMNLH
jgi:hypothetical protein